MSRFDIQKCWTVNIFECWTVDHSAFSNDECHVTALRPIGQLVRWACIIILNDTRWPCDGWCVQYGPLWLPRALMLKLGCDVVAMTTGRIQQHAATLVLDTTRCASALPGTCHSVLFRSRPRSDVWPQRGLTHTHTHLTALCLWLSGWAGTRKVKLIWILLKQETVSGSGISWVVCKSAPRSRQITTPAPQHSVFYRPDALPAAQPTASKHWMTYTMDTLSPFIPVLWHSEFCHSGMAR